MTVARKSTKNVPFFKRGRLQDPCNFPFGKFDRKLTKNLSQFERKTIEHPLKMDRTSTENAALFVARGPACTGGSPGAGQRESVRASKSQAIRASKDEASRFTSPPMSMALRQLDKLGKHRSVISLLIWGLGGANLAKAMPTWTQIDFKTSINWQPKSRQTFG